MKELINDLLRKMKVRNIDFCRMENITKQCLQQYKKAKFIDPERLLNWMRKYNVEVITNGTTTIKTK